MSTDKHINKICITITALTLVLTVLFMCGKSLGISVMASEMPYEKSLFDTSYVHTIDIVMNDWDSFIETCENEEYASCTVCVDGEKYSNVAIRAKGNTSLSSVSSLGSDRYSFKLEFDHYENGKTCDGLDKLCLNNLIQDNTMMKDYIVYYMMNDFEVDTPLCSFVYLTVNGEDWGLYLAVEGIEDSFLTRNYGSEDGDLYKPDSMSFGGGRGNGKDFNFEDLDFDFDFDTDESKTDKQTIPTMPDVQSGSFPGGMTFPGQSEDGQTGFPDGQGIFTPSEQKQPTTSDGSDSGSGGLDFSNAFSGMGSDDVKLKYIDDDPDSYSNIFDNAKTDVTDSDKTRLIQSLKNLTSYTDLENTVDIDEVLRYFVIHNFVCNGDSYTGSMIHNYYLYESDGVLSMIPWDYNLAFGTFQGNDASGTVNTSIDSPVSGGNVDDRPMLGWIFSSDEYTEKYHELFGEFIEKWFSNGELVTLIEETYEMILPYVEKDPTKFCTSDEFEKGVTALKTFVTLRAEAVSNQLTGNSTTVDTGMLSLSDMGTMNNAGGGTVPTMPDGQGSENGTIPTMPDGQGSAGGTIPTMPDGQGSANGTIPTMPDGQDSTGGTIPTMPDGQGSAGGTIPTMSDGQGSTDGTIPTMPGGQGSTGGTIPTMPDGQGASNRTLPVTSDGKDTSGEVSPAVPDINTDGSSDFQKNFPNGNPETPTDTATLSSDTTALILTGASVLVLAAGILVAVKKKY